MLSIAQMVLNSQYIDRNIGVYACLTNQIRYIGVKVDSGWTWLAGGILALSFLYFWCANCVFFLSVGATPSFISGTRVSSDLYIVFSSTLWKDESNQNIKTMCLKAAYENSRRDTIRIRWEGCC